MFSIFKLVKSASRIKNIYLITSTLFIIYVLLRPQPRSISSHFPSTTTDDDGAVAVASATTTIRHVLFSIASSSTSLPNRKPYLRLWYTPNSTRAFVFLDTPTQDPSSDHTLPPIIISASTSRFPYTFPSGLRSAIRVARIVKEAVDLNQSGIRWFVFGDDDTVFFTHNLVKVLSKYDHNRWYYVGSNSESYEQNQKYSFDMAFGGGGFAISYSLARVLAKVLDSCLVRYPHLYGSDARVFSCLAELGIELTHEPGFHQVDVRGDLLGMLSAHSLSPLLSLHHFDIVDPIFPGKSKIEALEHLFRAANLDPARILQKTVCYDHSKSYTLSLSWGYSVQIYEGNQLLPDLLPVQKTFRPWKRGRDDSSSHYMFNLREYPRDPCQRPVTFFLEDVDPIEHGVYTTYIRRNFGSCLRYRGIQSLERVEIFSQKLLVDIEQVKAPRRQCCDIVSSYNKTLVVKLRHCGLGELISMYQG